MTPEKVEAVVALRKLRHTTINSQNSNAKRNNNSNLVAADIKAGVGAKAHRIKLVDYNAAC